MTRHGKTRQRGSQSRLGAWLRRFFVGPPEELEAPASGLVPYDLPEFTPPLPSPLGNRLPDPVLEAEGYLREYIHPVIGDRPFDQDDEDFPVVCSNGCPEGWRG